MVHRSLDAIALDRRLLRRRGWISAEELEKQLAALPDTAHKIATDDGDAEAVEGETPRSAARDDEPATP